VQDSLNEQEVAASPGVEPVPMLDQHFDDQR